MTGETKAEASAIAANEAFYAAFAARDIAAMDGCWSHLTPIACTHPGWMTLHGRLEVLDSWRSILSNPGQPRVVCGDARATVIGDVAIVHCREFVAGSAIVATNVFALEGGRWRLVVHHGGPAAM